MKKIIVLLDNRKLLERIENETFANSMDFIDALKLHGMTEEEEESLGYYEISDFMDLVNDQIIDNLEETFIGHVNFNL